MSLGQIKMNWLCWTWRNEISLYLDHGKKDISRKNSDKEEMLRHNEKKDTCLQLLIFDLIIV